MLFFIYAIIGMQVCDVALLQSEAMIIYTRLHNLNVKWSESEKYELHIFIHLHTYILLLEMSPTLSLLQVFGNIELNEDTAINHHNNFRTFLQALMLLFRYSHPLIINQ